MPLSIPHPPVRFLSEVPTPLAAPHPLVIKCFLWPPTVQVSPVWWPMRTGLHHTGVELEGREGEAGFESPMEAGFDSPTIMVPITLLSRSSSQVSICAVWIKIRKRGGVSTEQRRPSTLVLECLCLLTCWKLRGFSRTLQGEVEGKQSPD